MRHHYVPQFLLRPWAVTSADRRIEVFRLDLGELRSSRRAPRYTAYENDLYAFDRPVVAGVEQHVVERVFLREVDDLAARVLRVLADEGLRGLSVNNRMDWARFLMSLRVRHPEAVEVLRNEGEQHLREELAAEPNEYDELAGIDDPPDFVEWTQQHFPGLIENFGLTVLPHLIDNQRIGVKILQMRWWLWDFANVPFELLLADNPCIFTSEIDDSNLVIALPISPKKAWMATNDNRVADLMRQQKPRDLAMRLNESSLRQTRARLYASSSAPMRFIQNRLCRRNVGRAC